MIPASKMIKILKDCTDHANKHRRHQKLIAKQVIMNQIEMKTDFKTLDAVRQIFKDDGFSIDHAPTHSEPYLEFGTPTPNMLLFIDDGHIYLTGPDLCKPGNNLITLDLADPEVFEKVKHHYHNDYK